MVLTSWREPMERAERTGMDMETLGGGRDEEAVQRFVERCALTLTEAGIPRMPARVFVVLLVSDDGRRTAAELAEMLKVSPAAVSNAVRYLQQVRLAVREREPGERRDHYRLYNDTWYEAVTQRDEMLRRWQEDMRGGSRPSARILRPGGGWRRLAGSTRSSSTRCRGSWRGGGRFDRSLRRKKGFDHCLRIPVCLRSSGTVTG